MKFVHKNYYELLDVVPGATEEQLRRAYRQVRTTWNPDSIAIYSLYTPEESAAIRHKIEEAWQVLSNPERRANYDRYLSMCAQPVQVRTPEAFWDLVHGFMKTEQKVALMADVSELLNETPEAEVVVEQLVMEGTSGEARSIEVVVRDEREGVRTSGTRASLGQGASSSQAATAGSVGRVGDKRGAPATAGAHAGGAAAANGASQAPASARERREGVPAAPAAPPVPPPPTPGRLNSPGWTPAASPRDVREGSAAAGSMSGARSPASGLPTGKAPAERGAEASERGTGASPQNPARPAALGAAPGLPTRSSPAAATNAGHGTGHSVTTGQPSAATALPAQRTTATASERAEVASVGGAQNAASSPVAAKSNGATAGATAGDKAAASQPSHIRSAPVLGPTGPGPLTPAQANRAMMAQMPTEKITPAQIAAVQMQLNQPHSGLASANSAPVNGNPMLGAQAQAGPSQAASSGQLPAASGVGTQAPNPAGSQATVQGMSSLSGMAGNSAAASGPAGSASPMATSTAQALEAGLVHGKGMDGVTGIRPLPAGLQRPGTGPGDTEGAALSLTGATGVGNSEPSAAPSRVLPAGAIPTQRTSRPDAWNEKEDPARAGALKLDAPRGNGTPSPLALEPSQRGPASASTTALPAQAPDASSTQSGVTGGWSRNFAAAMKPSRPLPERPMAPEALAELESKFGISGKYLKAVREFKGITLQDIAERTKIQTTYLKYLEDDKFGELPPAVYVEGFVNQVARLLKLDVKQTVSGFMRHYHKTQGGRREH